MESCWTSSAATPWRPRSRPRPGRGSTSCSRRSCCRPICSTNAPTPPHPAPTPPDRAQGPGTESCPPPGRGRGATVLVQSGTLEPGQDFICGSLAGRVRAMFDERGGRVEKAGPSMPVQVLGFESVPEAGDSFAVVAQASEARKIAQKRQRLEREAHHRRSSRSVSLEDLSKEIGEGKAAALKIIIKADQGGPAEALADAFAQLSTTEVKVEVVHRGVGGITESDVLLAKASQAIIVGFHVQIGR